MPKMTAFEHVAGFMGQYDPSIRRAMTCGILKKYGDELIDAIEEANDGTVLDIIRDHVFPVIIDHEPEGDV